MLANGHGSVYIQYRQSNPDQAVFAALTYQALSGMLPSDTMPVVKKPSSESRGTHVPKMKNLLVAVVVAVAMLAPSLVASAQASGNMYFNNTWQRTDKPVADGNVSRTWMWGPSSFTVPLLEPYAEAPGGEREVQYFDKSRMEITNPSGDTSSIWYVTNGLLVVEMTSGNMQVGHNEWESLGPAFENVAGDADDEFGPMYATIGWNIQDGHTFQDGQLITGVIDWLGYDEVMSDAMYNQLAAYGVTAGPYSPETGKHTASVFWQFMNSNALVYQNGSLVNAPLFENPYYATGLPIDQAWWAEVKVAGTYKWVLVQCFERRCLTYTPDNPAGWQVEAGNVGQHYYNWRYGGGPVDPSPMTELEYVGTMLSIDDDFLWSIDYVDDLWTQIDPYDPEWVNAVRVELLFWRELAAEIDTIIPPARYANVHQQIVEAYDYIVVGSFDLQDGIETVDADLVGQGWETFDIGWALLDEAIAELLEIAPQLTEAEYIQYVWSIDDEFVATMAVIEDLWDFSDVDDPEWVDDFVWELEYLAGMFGWFLDIDAPSGYASLHSNLIDVYTEISVGADLLIDGVLTKSGGSQLLGWVTIDNAVAELGVIMATFPPGQ